MAMTPFGSLRGPPSQFGSMRGPPTPFGPSMPPGFGQSAQPFGPSLPPGFGGPSMSPFGSSMPAPIGPAGSFQGFYQGGFEGSWGPTGGSPYGGRLPRSGPQVSTFPDWKSPRSESRYDERFDDRRGDEQYDGRHLDDPNEPDYLTDPDYCRVTRITKAIYLTNKTGGLCEGLLERLRITLVICASESREVEPPKDPYCDFRRIPVPNDPTPDGPNITQYFDEVCELIQHEEEKGGRVLVQSLKGRCRGPTLVIAYLMRVKGMKLCDAFGLVSGQRPITRPFVAFWKQLIAYELQIFGTVSVSM